MREEFLIATTLAWVAWLAPEIKAAAFETEDTDLLTLNSPQRVASQKYGMSARRRRRTVITTTMAVDMRQIRSSERLSSGRLSLRNTISKPKKHGDDEADNNVVSGDDDDEHSYKVELFLGIGVGISLSALTVCLWAGCCRSKSASTHRGEGGTVSAPRGSALSFAGDLIDLPTVFYGGAFFRQFSWCLDPIAIDPETGALRVLDAEGRQVVQVVGRLMATPNGEVHLLNSAGIPWAGLKRPVPSRRQGQLWDFRICGAGGAPYAEVKQRSETKAIVVEPPPTQRRLMTVIGNFGHRVFLTGERSIHIWTAGDSQHVLGAQCEVRVEAVRCSEVTGQGQHTVTPVRSFYVSATMLVDAPLALAVLIGLQQVQTRLGYAPPVPASPDAAGAVPSGTLATSVDDDIVIDEDASSAVGMTSFAMTAENK